jgi:ATPase subunit of ABC transporter with duplicated ATPase domains
MHSQRLDYYKGNFAQFYATKEERAKNQRKEYEAQQVYRAGLQAYIDRWRYNANRAPQAQSRIKILEKLPVLEPPTEEQGIKFTFQEADKLSPPVLQLEDASFSYTEGGKTILSGVDLDIGLESRLGLIGPNVGSPFSLPIARLKLESTGSGQVDPAQTADWRERTDCRQGQPQRSTQSGLLCSASSRRPRHDRFSSRLPRFQVPGA